MRMRELDFPAKLWAVPAERMKTEDDAEGTSFEVPLSGPAVAILSRRMPRLTPTSLRGSIYGSYKAAGAERRLACP